MEDKLKVFEVCNCQLFDYYWYEFKLFKRIKKTDRFKELYKFDYILARTDEEAVKIYKQRYEWQYENPIDYHWYWGYGKVILSKTPNYDNEIIAIETHLTFDEMKKKLRAEELLAFCKQEMYPVEVLIRQ